jgi:hypothetical protein
LQVQALYHHPSLGSSIELVLVRLDIMKNQPSKMPHHNGERSRLLDSFCAYQSSLNIRDDENPEHWDMAVYISGYKILLHHFYSDLSSNSETV